MLLALAWVGPVPAALAQEQGGEARGGEGDEASETAMSAAEEHMDDERAREHFLAGRALYDSGRFDEAAEEFEQAYGLSDRPELLYNLYIAHRDAGNVRRAAESLRSYLTEVEAPPDRISLEARLENLEAQVEQLDAAEEARREQQQREDRREQRRRERQREPADAGGPGVLPWIVAGVGGAVLVAGGVTGVLALGAAGEIDDECGGEGCPRMPRYGEYDEDLDSAGTLVQVTDYLLLGGGVLVAAGVGWALLAGGAESHDPPEQPAAASAACASDGCAASVRVSF